MRVEGGFDADTVDRTLTIIDRKQALSKVVKDSPPGGRDNARFDAVNINMDDPDEDATEAFEREQQQVRFALRFSPDTIAPQTLLSF